MSVVPSSGLDNFIKANADHFVSGFDYVHIEYLAHSLHPDFVMCFCKLVWPDFRIIDGLIFLEDLFNESRYQELVLNETEINRRQFWMNLLEITGMFNDMSLSEDVLNEMSVPQALLVADILVKSWNAKIQSEYPHSLERARRIYDEELGEVFVTIDVDS